MRSIDGAELDAPPPQSDRSWTAHFRKTDGKWAIGRDGRTTARCASGHGLQGPIDDAFMDSFLMVRPTGHAAATRRSARGSTAR